jgi:dTDP-4-dehydrorhamnose 3,5-epimerase
MDGSAADAIMVMQVTPTAIGGVFTLTAPAHHDDRGWFQRGFCQSSLAAAGISFAPRQTSLSHNPVQHTLRGLHWQQGDDAECKIVRCLTGAIWDVAVDLRRNSPTYLHHIGLRLDSGAQGSALLIPRGVAHGFITLTPDALVSYMVDQDYAAQSASGARWDDPAFGIAWPATPAVIGARDQNWPDYPHG